MKYPIALLLVLVTSLPAVAAPKPEDWAPRNGRTMMAHSALLNCESRVNRKWRNILKGTRQSLSEARTSKDKTIQAKIPTIEAAIMLGEKHRLTEVRTCQFPIK
jgi:hypothetical protein